MNLFNYRQRLNNLINNFWILQNEGMKRQYTSTRPYLLFWGVPLCSPWEHVQHISCDN